MPPVLLHEAKMAQRLVVLLSDHGHVLDSKTEGKFYDGGKRWRLPTSTPEAKELQISESRVLLPNTNALIAPWTERLRYGVKKNGYHGGISPQEMIVPIVVLCSNDKHPNGWVEAPMDTPGWWDEPLRDEVRKEQAPPEEKPIKKTQGLGPLFDFAQRIEQTETKLDVVETSLDTLVPQWIVTLLASPTLDEQKKRAGRAVPADEVFVKLLTALDRRGSKLTATALARAMGYPPLRLPGLPAMVQRILNVDGYPVLIRDDAQDTVELNRELLRRQFDLVSDQ